VSVLTDERFFQGSLDDLVAARRAVGVPVLCKDFVIDEFQVYRARAAGADAVLLIVAALADGQLAALHELANELGMAALVEVHGGDELERALRIQPRLLGINNRDLKTFDVDLAVTEQLASLVPPGTALVGESGIFSASDVARLARAGVDAVLVGEALMTAGDVAARVSELSGVERVRVR
jgi:indole-3-glycerol phosphate synthase